MSIFPIDHNISTLNFRTGFQTRDSSFISIPSFLFCFDSWPNIQYFIFGVGMPIFPIHLNISIVNFHTDFHSGKVNSDFFRFDFWLDIQDFIFGLDMSNIHHEVSTLNFHNDLQTGDTTCTCISSFVSLWFLTKHSRFHFWAWYVNFPYSPWHFNLKLSHWLSIWKS